MRALLFIVVLSLSACADVIAPDPLPACVTSLAYERVDEVCTINPIGNRICQLVPVGETHPVTVCR